MQFMNKKIFNEAKQHIISSDLEIAEAEFEEATNSWSITLETIKKIKISWNSADNFFSVNEATIDKDTKNVTWRCIFASRLSSDREILATLENILQTNKG